MTASVTSSTHERKSKTWILTKKGRFYLRHGAFQCAGPSLIPCQSALRICTLPSLRDRASAAYDAFA